MKTGFYSVDQGKGLKRRPLPWTPSPLRSQRSTRPTNNLQNSLENFVTPLPLAGSEE
jgi:hypothetical protein